MWGALNILKGSGLAAIVIVTSATPAGIAPIRVVSRICVVITPIISAVLAVGITTI